MKVGDLRRYNVESTRTKIKAAEEKFLSKVDRENGPMPVDITLGKCWSWLGGSDRYGQPMFQAFSRNYSARRFCWMMTTNTDLYAETHLINLCKNVLCVNPKHHFIREKTVVTNTDAMGLNTPVPSLDSLIDKGIRVISLQLDSFFAMGEMRTEQMERLNKVMGILLQYKKSEGDLLRVSIEKMSDEAIASLIEIATNEQRNREANIEPQVEETPGQVVQAAG